MHAGEERAARVGGGGTKGYRDQEEKIPYRVGK